MKVGVPRAISLCCEITASCDRFRPLAYAGRPSRMTSEAAASATVGGAGASL